MSRKIIVLIITIFAVYGICILTSFAGSDEAVHTNHVHGADAHIAAGITKLIGWLGKFHPVATHFPIALIIAAAIAEILFAGTCKTLFDNARRYCLWFGIIGAVCAGTLGWFFAGFKLVDENWLLTTHRWLGSSTVVCSLLLGWVAWPGAKYGQRLWYRLVLFLAVILVSATGFFGGAMLYGLNQYAW